MKKLGLVVSLLLIVTFLSGCYTAPPPSPQTPFTLGVSVDKNVYRIGEKIVITVQASQGCYLTLYDISTVGEVTQIFPNQFASDNLIKGGVTYHIPTEADSFDFEITGPPGIERVRAVGTIENVNLVDQRKIDATETFPKIRQSRDQFDQSLSQKLAVMPTERWTETSITFQVAQ